MQTRYIILIIFMFIALSFYYVREDFGSAWSHWSWNQGVPTGFPLPQLIWKYTPTGKPYVKTEDENVWDKDVKRNYKDYQTT